MEPYNLIDITVDLGTSMRDGILFQKQTPENVYFKDSSCTADSYTWLVQTHDGLNYGSIKSFESRHAEQLMCCDNENRKDASKEEYNLAQGSSSHMDSMQVRRDKDLSPDQYVEQIKGRTREDNTSSTKVKFIQLRTDIDPILASCFMCEMKHSQVYRRIFLNNLFSWCCSLERTSKLQKKPNAVRLALDLRESNLFKMEPDIRWSKKMLPLWLARISMEDSFSWLSTLGGAYSALGDDFQHFAEKAGRVSIHQMKLACQIGDPILLARCRVYMAQSLMQKGFIQQAMFIVRAQYRFAVSLGEHTDQRLINMCKGVWSIIQYLHRRQKKCWKNGVGLQPSHTDVR